MDKGLAMPRRFCAENTSLKKHLTEPSEVAVSRKLRDFAAVKVFHFESQYAELVCLFAFENARWRLICLKLHFRTKEIYPPWFIGYSLSSADLVSIVGSNTWEYAKMPRSICEYLQSRLKDYIAQKRESVRWFSKQSGVDYTTIYRLNSGEQKKLSFINAKKILTLIEPENTASILADYFPREASELGTKSGADEQAAILADDLQLYKVYAFAEMESKGREAVKDEFGKEGLRLLDRLLQIGILVEDESGFRSTLEGRAYPPEEVIKKTAIHHFHMVPLSAAGSICEDVRGGLSEEGIRDLYDAVVELREKVLRIMAEKKGNQLAVMSVIAGPGDVR
jgi:hypothetical protein